MTALEIRPTDMPCNGNAERLPRGGWPAIVGFAKPNRLPPKQHEGDHAPGGYRYASIHHAFHCADLARRSGSAGLAAAQPGLATWSRDHAPADLHAMSADHWRPDHG